MTMTNKSSPIPTASIQPSTSGIETPRYHDDGEVPGPSGINKPNAKTDSDGDECIASSVLGHNVVEQGSHNNASPISTGIDLLDFVMSSTSVEEVFRKYPSALGVVTGTIKSRYHSDDKKPDPAYHRETKHNATKGNQSADSAGNWCMVPPSNSNQDIIARSCSSRDTLSPVSSFASIHSNPSSVSGSGGFQSYNSASQYNVFAKPILGDDRSPWQQRMVLLRRDLVANDLTIGNYDCTIAFVSDVSNGDDSSIYTIDVTSAIEERVAEWLAAIRAEMETAEISLPDRLCGSDTNVIAGKKRKREDGENETMNQPKRSKSGSSISNSRTLNRRFSRSRR